MATSINVTTDASNINTVSSFFKVCLFLIFLFPILMKCLYLFDLLTGIIKLHTLLFIVNPLIFYILTHQTGTVE